MAFPDYDFHFPSYISTLRRWSKWWTPYPQFKKYLIYCLGKTIQDQENISIKFILSSSLTKKFENKGLLNDLKSMINHFSSDRQERVFPDLSVNQEDEKLFLKCYQGPRDYIIPLQAYYAAREFERGSFRKHRETSKYICNIISSLGYHTSSLEAFTEPTEANLPNYCSLFYEIDRTLGSKGSLGSFLTLPITTPSMWKDYKCIVACPPKYLPTILDTIKILKTARKHKISSILLLPDWRSKEQVIEQSPKVETRNRSYKKRKTERFLPYDESLNFADKIICHGHSNGSLSSMILVIVDFLGNLVNAF
jgi:hypothetical protein